MELYQRRKVTRAWKIDLGPTHVLRVSSPSQRKPSCWPPPHCLPYCQQRQKQYAMQFNMNPNSLKAIIEHAHLCPASVYLCSILERAPTLLSVILHQIGMEIHPNTSLHQLWMFTKKDWISMYQSFENLMSITKNNARHDLSMASSRLLLLMA